MKLLPATVPDRPAQPIAWRLIQVPAVYYWWAMVSDQLGGVDPYRRFRAFFKGAPKAGAGLRTGDDAHGLGFYPPGLDEIERLLIERLRQEQREEELRRIGWGL